MAQAIPAYFLSCFKLPNSICDDLAGMVRKFWWGQNNGVNKTGWLSWEKMCRPKQEGGMGFRDLKAFNIDLLAKQGWRLQTCPNSLFYRVFKAKYFPNHEFIDANIGGAPSFAWRSLMAVQKVVKSGCHWLIGNGESASVWGDKWLPTPSSFQIVSPVRILQPNARVSKLIDHQNGT